MLVGMPWGSRGRKSSARGRGALILLLLMVALIGGAVVYSHVQADAARPSGTIVLYGDSLSTEASPYFTDELARTTQAQVITKAVPGTTPCSAMGTMRDDATRRPDVVVIQYVGNNATPCTSDTSGVPLTGQALADRYEADVRAAVDMFASEGTRVVLVGGPDAPGLPGGAAMEIADAYHRIVDEWDDRASGRVRYADAAGTVTGPDHRFVAELPCASDEGPGEGCREGEVEVRSPDRAHFCPAPGVYMVCPVPNPGARRFGHEMARAAREALND
jgi:hypothetical protein